MTAKSNKKCHLVFGHFPSNGGRVYYISATLIKSKKIIEQVRTLSDVKEYNGEVFKSMESEIRAAVEAKGYQVDMTRVEERLTRYKAI